MRRGLILMLVMAMALAVAACGKKTGDSDDKAQDMVMHTTFKEAVFDTEYVKNIYGDGDDVMILGTSYDTVNEKTNIDIIRYNPVSGEQTKNVITIDGIQVLGSVMKCKDGYAAVITEHGRIATDYKDVTYIALFDGKLERSGEVELSGVKEFVESKGGYFDTQLVLADETYFYFSCDGLFVKADYDGNIVSSLEYGGWIINAAMLGSGNIAAYGSLSDSHGMQAVLIDTEKMKMGEPIAHDGGDILYIFPDNEEGFCTLAGQKVFKYNPETSLMEEVFDLLDCAVLFSEGGICMAPDGSFVTVSLTVGAEDETSGGFYCAAEISTTKKVPADTVPAKKEITLAVLYLGEDVKESVIKFNRTSEEYKVKVKSYTDDVFSANPAEMEQFKLDMAAGDVADLYMASYGNGLAEMAAKGLFTDLGELFAQDEYLNPDNMLPQVVDALTYDGKVFGISQQFSLYTLVGSSDFVGEEGELTYEKMLAYMEKHPDSQVIADMPRDILLSMLVGGSMDMFCDFGEGTCDFESPEFVNLLKLASLAPADYSQMGTQNADGFLDGTVMADVVNISGQVLYTVQLYNRIFGDKVSFVGYPGKEKSGALIGLNQVCCISSKSQNKDGAASFIKYLFETQEKALSSGMLGALPARKDLLDEMVTRMAGDKDRHVSYNYFGLDVNLGQLTDEDVEAFYRVLGSVTGVQ